MASSSSLFASTKRRSKSSPQLLMLAGEEKTTYSREVATRSLDLTPMDDILDKTGGDCEDNKYQQSNRSLREDPPIPVDAVTVIATTDSSNEDVRHNCCEAQSTNSLFSRNLEVNNENDKQKICHIQNGAFAHQEANLITVEYDSSDDSGEDLNKHNKQRRSRLDQWTNKFRTLFRSKDKDNYLDDKENRVQEASDSDDENNCMLSDYDKCRERTRSQSLYGCLRKYVRNKEESEKGSPPSGKKKPSKSSFFPKRNRSRSRSKKSKQGASQPPESRKCEKQSKKCDGKTSDSQSMPNSSGLGHFALTPIEQAELLDTGLPLPSGSTETQGTVAPSQVEVSNNTIVTQDLYGQFGSHTQNGYIPRTVHTQIDYIHCLVPKLKLILDSPCYWGKIDRYQADALLENKPEGTYLLRDSAQEEFLFSVSFRRYGRSLHARLEQWSHRFSFDAHDPGVYSSDTVTGLLEHYKDPNCCMFFEPMLTTPLPRPNPHSLKELCRGVVCSNITYDAIHCLKVPQMFKEYLREYHYKQRVRVRRFEIDYLPQTSSRRQTLTNTCISY